MLLSSILYATFLVFVVIPRPASTAIRNETHEQTVPTGGLASFLKVPWINLNSSWEDKVANRCRNDVVTLFDSADSGEMWALQMLDATSKIPSGILKGNIYDLGSYDECVGVNARHNSANIQGQHCKVSLAFPTELVAKSDAAEVMLIQKLSFFNPSADVDLSLSLSVCLPSSCDVGDVEGIVDASIKSSPNLYKLKTKIARVTCWSVNSVDNPTVGTIIAISFFLMIGGLLLLSTVCDSVVRSRSGDAPSVVKTFAKFSLYTNTRKLFSTRISPETMPAINGIRFLSTILILGAHRIVVMVFKPLINLSDLLEFRQSVVTSIGLVLLYAVDTFFLITGFLTTYLFLKRMKSGVRINLPVFYLHRYIRLVPCIGILILFNVFIIPYLGSGPLWEDRLESTVDYCRKNWWTNLLFIHNLVNRTEMCLPHTWTSAVEMQLYLLCPIILYPLFHRPRLGLVILSVFSIASFITPVVQIFLYDYSLLIDLHKSAATILHQLFYSYTTTYNRALPYFIGIFLGYDVVNHKRRVTKVQAVFNWILACIFLLCCFWSGYHVQPNAIVYDAVWEAVFVSFGRLGWGLAMAWIIYACTQGYGGPVARFLSLPIFLPLSRMSYGIYLVSIVFQMGLQSTGRTAAFDLPVSTLHLVFGDLAICIVIAFILNVCIETPAIILEGLIIAKRPFTIVKPASMLLKEKPLAVVRGYFDLFNDRSDPDPIIGTKMRQLNSWQATSHLLNTISKGNITTSEEWKKLDFNGTLKTCNQPWEKNEEEFLTFLLAMTSAWDESTNSKDEKTL